MGFNENIRSRYRPCLRDLTRLKAQQFRPIRNFAIKSVYVDSSGQSCSFVNVRVCTPCATPYVCSTLCEQFVWGEN